jgi:hypothetical protein
MKYRYATNKPNYADLASGKVFVGLPGHVATPIRLVDELFQQGLEFLHRSGIPAPTIVFDPCCGTAYHLAALAFLHWTSVAKLIASDVDAGVLLIAKRNLDLLSVSGLNKRIETITRLYEQFGKASHKEALEAAYRLKNVLVANNSHVINCSVFHGSVFDGDLLMRHIPPGEVSLVLTDVPYRRGSQWEAPHHASESTWTSSGFVAAMLDSLAPLVLPNQIVCLLTSKDTSVSHSKFVIRRRARVGKRNAIILQRTV